MDCKAPRYSSACTDKKKATETQKKNTHKRFPGERNGRLSRYHARHRYLTRLHCEGRGVGSRQGQKAGGAAEDKRPSPTSMRMSQRTVRSLQLQLLELSQNDKRDDPGSHGQLQPSDFYVQTTMEDTGRELEPGQLFWRISFLHIPSPGAERKPLPCILSF